MFHLKSFFHSQNIDFFKFCLPLFSVGHYLRGWSNIDLKVYDIMHHSFLPPLKLEGGVFRFLKFGQRGSWKNCSEIRRLVKKGGGLQIVSSVFLKESMFSLLLQYSFLSGKYSQLLWSIDLFFHVVYLLLDNDILWNSFPLTYSYSISLKTSNILENKSQVFERSDYTITVHNDLYYNEL